MGGRGPSSVGDSVGGRAPSSVGGLLRLLRPIDGCAEDTIHGLLRRGLPRYIRVEPYQPLPAALCAYKAQRAYTFKNKKTFSVAVAQQLAPELQTVPANI